jgi:hypothetical protein
MLLFQRPASIIGWAQFLVAQSTLAAPYGHKPPALP